MPVNVPIYDSVSLARLSHIMKNAGTAKVLRKYTLAKTVAKCPNYTSDSTRRKHHLRFLIAALYIPKE